MFENFSEYFEQIKRAIISFNTLGDLLDVLLVAFVIYSGVKLIRETRAIQLAKGVILLAIVYFFVSLFNMETSKYILSLVFGNLLIILVIIFSPEIRHALESVGRSSVSNISLLNFKKRDEQEQEEIIKLWKDQINITDPNNLKTIEQHLQDGKPKEDITKCDLSKSENKYQYNLQDYSCAIQPTAPILYATAAKVNNENLSPQEADKLRKDIGLYNLYDPQNYGEINQQFKKDYKKHVYSELFKAVGEDVKEFVQKGCQALSKGIKKANKVAAIASPLPSHRAIARCALFVDTFVDAYIQREQTREKSNKKIAIIGGSYLQLPAVLKAKELGYKGIVITGDPDFYHRFGFLSAKHYDIHYNDYSEEELPFFMALELEKGYFKEPSIYNDPDVYNADPYYVAEFDKTFPYKEKKVLPTQIF